MSVRLDKPLRPTYSDIEALVKPTTHRESFHFSARLEIKINRLHFIILRLSSGGRFLTAAQWKISMSTCQAAVIGAICIINCRAL